MSEKPQLLATINLASEYEFSEHFDSWAQLMRVSDILMDLSTGKRTRPYNIQARHYKFLYRTNRELFDHLMRKMLLNPPEEIINWAEGKKDAAEGIRVKPRDRTVN